MVPSMHSWSTLLGWGTPEGSMDLLGFPCGQMSGEMLVHE